MTPLPAIYNNGYAIIYEQDVQTPCRPAYHSRLEYEIACAEWYAKRTALTAANTAPDDVDYWEVKVDFLNSCMYLEDCKQCKGEGCINCHNEGVFRTYHPNGTPIQIILENKLAVIV